MLFEFKNLKIVWPIKILIMVSLFVFGVQVESKTETKDWLKDKEVIKFISHMHKNHKFSLKP